MDNIGSIRRFNRFYTSKIGLFGRVGLDGLNLTESRALYEIGSQEALNARELVKLLGLDEGYISRTVKSLERRSLITRTPSPSDARVFELSLTNEGVRNHAILIRKAESAVSDMIATLSNSTVDQMLEAMATVEGILAWPSVPEPKIRGLNSGDVGWVVKRHGELYSANSGFDITFESLVAKIMSEFIQASDNPKNKGWISESNGLRLGCVFIVAEDNHTARLRLMLVEPFARGKGVGQTLIEMAINHARAEGFNRIVLWTQKDLKAACRLYERNGFKLNESSPDNIFGQKVINQSWELNL